MANSKKRKTASTESPAAAEPAGDLAKEAATASTSKEVVAPAPAKSAEAKPTPSNKRKRKHTSSETKQKSGKSIFNGLTLALSTLESKSTQREEEEESAQYTNFKTLATLLKSHGATISPQVHKRVHYLICTTQAVENLTQRVRQAIKRNVEIINVDWIKACIDTNGRVHPEEYLLNTLARELMAEKEQNDKNTQSNTVTVGGGVKDGYESDIPDENAVGWSEPIELDCCCVCHENGDEECPWCTECNINLANKKKK